MTHPLPQAAAAFAALLVVTLTWLPTVSAQPSTPRLAETVRIVTLA